MRLSSSPTPGFPLRLTGQGYALSGEETGVYTIMQQASRTQKVLLVTRLRYPQATAFPLDQRPPSPGAQSLNMDNGMEQCVWLDVFKGDGLTVTYSREPSSEQVVININLLSRLSSPRLPQRPVINIGLLSYLLYFATFEFFLIYTLSTLSCFPVCFCFDIAAPESFP